ncbi:hypothetical protein K504DRAFT_468269 [Pleomassaria siparia CBS 279.74]|uniref:Carboxymuconolactone decarboxylase-like domain-containing protein n=1 Tax=Pleomassaria siparia CBS 279.74 TaxID=1314801 RepID=A0A6G1K9E4_9PLEO|nr:hypothetical protein K504DRAFT_468269 [Pleomassaria siparia CBS 279.74]
MIPLKATRGEVVVDDVGGERNRSYVHRSHRQDGILTFVVLTTCVGNLQNTPMRMLMRRFAHKPALSQQHLSSPSVITLLSRRPIPDHIIPPLRHHARYRLRPISSTSVNRKKMGTDNEVPSAPKVEARAAELFLDIEQALASTKLGKDRWYILALAALVGGTEPEMADQLYLHIISKPEFQSTSARQSLVRRLREALVKLVSIVGVCKPLEAIIAIAKVEKEEDRDYSFSREHWQCDKENHDKGMDWMRQIYTHNVESTLDLFKAHQDFRWISTEITYGLYLSDRQTLDDLDTELVVLVGIMIQNLRLETHWHIRGTRRIGVSREDVETIIECVRKVAKLMGTSLSKIPTVEEVEKDV